MEIPPFPSDEDNVEEVIEDSGYNEDEDDCSLFDRYQSFEEYLLKKGFTEECNGSFRQTYLRGKVVIKVPRNEDGIIDNMTEAAAWRKYKSDPTNRGIFLAPCRLLPNQCLMMVTVDTRYLSIYDADVPLWVSRVEGHQAGRWNGKVVAYDYALDIDERYDWEKEWKVRSDYFHERERYSLSPI